MSPILTKQNLFHSGISKRAHPNYFHINFIHLTQVGCAYRRHDVNQIHVHIGHMYRTALLFLTLKSNHHHHHHHHHHRRRRRRRRRLRRRQGHPMIPLCRVRGEAEI